jgi:hypothetical protein
MTRAAELVHACKNQLSTGVSPLDPGPDDGVTVSLRIEVFLPSPLSQVAQDLTKTNLSMLPIKPE